MISEPRQSCGIGQGSPPLSEGTGLLGAGMIICSAHCQEYFIYDIERLFCISETLYNSSSAGRIETACEVMYSE